MSIKSFFKNLTEDVQVSASIKKVYGEPVNVQSKTIIPVAQVAYGFGGGFKDKLLDEDNNSQEITVKDKGQLGLGVFVKPVGVLEVTPEKTSFIPINSTKKRITNFLIATAVGVVTNMIFKRRRSNRLKRRQANTVTE